MKNQAAAMVVESTQFGSQEVEARAYGADSTEDEIRAIKSRVYLVEGNVIYWQEVPVMSCWQVERFGEKIEQLLGELEQFHLLIDLRVSRPPSAPIREALRKVFSPLPERGLLRAAAFTEKNFFINVAAKLVLGGAGLAFSVHSNKSDAELALRR